jgi:hypothetical protein
MCIKEYLITQEEDGNTLDILYEAISDLNVQHRSSLPFANRWHVEVSKSAAVFLV